MAIFYCRMKKSSRGGKRLLAVAHLHYINREERYKNKEDLIEKRIKNLPEEFKNIEEFWKFCELYERKNANLFRELEIALPKELTQEENKKLVKAFAEHLFGDDYVYNYAIHQPKDFGGEPQPHVHIMFCERKLDGIKRTKEQFFKQHYSFNPEKSGAKKNVYWTKREALENIRKDWEMFLNFELEKRGIEKVSRKSLREQKRDAEANGDYEKAKRLDREPIQIEGSILYKKEKKLTEEEKIKKEIFKSKRILRAGSEHIKKLFDKIKDLKEKLSKMTKEEYEILERIREINSQINLTKSKIDDTKIENTVYNLMSNKQYYNLLNENKKIEKELKNARNKNKIMQLKIKRDKNIEMIENIRKDIKNNPKKRYIFNKRVENIKNKYEKKIKELEKEKQEYFEEIKEKYKGYDDIQKELYSKKHLHYILQEKGEKEIRNIEREFNKLLEVLNKDSELVKEEIRIKNKLTTGEYEEVNNEIEQLKKDIEYLKKEIKKERVDKEIYKEMLDEKTKILEEKEIIKRDMDIKIKTQFDKEIKKNFNPKIKEKIRIEKILENIDKTRKIDKILKKDIVEKQKNKLKSRTLKRNRLHLNTKVKTEDGELRGNFTLKDLENLEDYDY